MSRPIAILDANVLYPAELRSFLLYMYTHGAFHPRWTDEIHAEWMSNLLANRPDLTRAKLERTRGLMDRAAPEAAVTGYRRIISKLTLPDERDRHVLAAAIHCKAQIVVTNNVRDFPAQTLAPFGIQAQTPDSFVVGLWDQLQEKICAAAEKHRLSWMNPPATVPEYLEVLARLGMIRTAELINQYAQC